MMNTILAIVGQRSAPFTDALRGLQISSRWVGSALVLAWSMMATYWIRNPYWVTIPFFTLLGAAGVYTGLACLSSRTGSHGSSILGTGFLLWGAHMFAFPLVEMSPHLMPVLY